MLAAASGPLFYWFLNCPLVPCMADRKNLMERTWRVLKSRGAMKMSTNRRVIPIPENAKRGSNFRIELTPKDCIDGVIVRMRINHGPEKDFVLRPRSVNFAFFLGFPHRGAESRGSLRYSVPTFKSYEDFTVHCRGSSDATLAIADQTMTTGHRAALGYLAYASLPKWARDEDLYRRKWGSNTALRFPFGGEPTYHGGNQMPMGQPMPALASAGGLGR